MLTRDFPSCAVSVPVLKVHADQRLGKPPCTFDGEFLYSPCGRGYDAAPLLLPAQGGYTQSGNSQSDQVQQLQMELCEMETEMQDLTTHCILYVVTDSVLPWIFVTVVTGVLAALALTSVAHV